MAQASLLHHQQSSNNPAFFSQDYQQPQLEYANHPETTTRPLSISQPRQPLPMAQPFLQQYRPESCARSQQWSQMPTSRQSYGDTQPGRSSNNATYAQDDIWGAGSMFDHGFALNSSLHMTPQIMSESAASSYSNNELMYPGSAVHQFVNKDSAHYGDGFSWVPQRSTEVPRGVSVNGSDPDSISSHSPKSYVSEVTSSEVLPFTPEQNIDAGSENINWSSYSTQNSAVVKASSPSKQIAVINNVSSVDFSSVPPLGLGISVPSSTPIGGSHHFNGLPLVCDDSSQYESDYSYSQKGSPGVSPWFPNSGSVNMAGMPYRPREPPINSLPAGYQIGANDSTPNGFVAWGAARSNVPARNHFHDHVQAPRVVDPQAQRKADDEILLEGKRKGLTYKEIRRKMHTKCAESTLRGRYRSLTKARQDRVRKPVWRSKDVELLTEFVTQDLDRVDANHHHALSYEQRLAKVQWKKVADSIHAHGGSYHFGNSTCKRKWQELNPEP